MLPRVSDESADMPSVNFEELHVGHRVEMEKLRMLLEYFARPPAPERRTVGIHRVALAADATMGTIAWDAPLCPVEMRPLRESIDAPCHRGAATIRVDFANCIIGGAALSYGNVQEEIMFVECPEMLCARAVCPPAQGHEAVVLRGCAQFSDHAGYGGSLAYGGPHHDDAAAIAASCVVAVDAVDYRGASTAHQYTSGSQYRELVKLVAGFGGALRVLSDTEAPGRPQVAVVTGNWGCGVFRGDARVKFLLQWIAASLCGCRLVYCPFDNALLATAVPPLVAALLGRPVSCRQLWNAVLADTKALVAASTLSVDGALGIAAAWAAGLRD
jgi:poly(ADP-ribose) glycohydrolase